MNDISFHIDPDQQKALIPTGYQLPEAIADTEHLAANADRLSKQLQAGNLSLLKITRTQFFHDNKRRMGGFLMIVFNSKRTHRE